MVISQPFTVWTGHEDPAHPGQGLVNKEHGPFRSYPAAQDFVNTLHEDTFWEILDSVERSLARGKGPNVDPNPKTKKN